MFSTKTAKKNIGHDQGSNQTLLLIIGLFIFIILLFSVFVGRHLERTHYPKINKLETVKFDIALAHLQFEEGAILDDSTFNNPHILEAKTLVNNLLPSASWEDYFSPIVKANQQKEIKALLYKLNKFELLLKSHKDTPENKVKHDATYFNLLISIEKLQKSLESVYLKQINTLHTIQRINLLLFVIYMAFVFYVEKRYSRLRKTFLKAQKERLKEKEVAQYFLEESQNMSKLGYYTFDLKKKYWRASKTITDILGLPIDEGFLTVWTNLIHPEDKHILTDVLEKRLKDPNTPLNVTYRLIRPKDGKTLWIHHLAQDIKFNSKGEKLPVLGVIQDITEHKEALNTLMLNKKELINVVESIADALFFITVEPTGKFIFKNVNTAFLRATGLKEEQVIGKTIEMIIPKPLSYKVLENCKKAITSKKAVIWEEELSFNTYFKTGIVGISPIYDEKGVCTHLVGSVHNITERKKAEEALKIKEELYRSVFENAPLGIFHFNVQGIITECNTELVRILDSSYKELIGFELFEKLSDKKLLLAVKETLKKGTGYYEENYTSVTGSTTTPLVIHFKAIYNTSNKIIGGVGLVEDVTERYELHKSLVKSKKELLKSQKIAQLGTYNLNLLTQKFKSSTIFDALVGLKPTDAKTFTTWRTITHPEDTPDNQKMLDNCIKTGEKFDREYRIITKDTKEIKWLYGLGEVIFKDKVATNFVGTIQDITERKLAEEKLIEAKRKIEESEVKFRELYEKSGDAILIIKNGVFIECNNATIKLLGCNSKEELLNLHPSNLSPKTQPDGQDSLIESEKMMAIALEKGTHRFEWVHTKSNGENFPVEVLLTAISNKPDNKVIHCVWRDISERKEVERVILENERKLKEAQEITRLGTFIFDDSTDLFETSPIFDEILGLEPSYKRDINGWINLVYPKDYKKVQELFDDNNETTISREFRIIRPIDKKIIWIFGKAKKEFDAKGKRSLITGTVQDITERKEAEKKLRQSDAILSKLNSLVVVNDGHNNITYVSPSVKEILGYEPNDLLGKGWWQLTYNAPEEAKKVQEDLFNYVYNKGTKTKRVSARIIKTKEGKSKHIEWYISKGVDNTYISIGIDVTQKYEEEKKYKALTDTAFAAIIIVDQKGIITDWNTSAEKMFGHTKEEAVGSNMSIIIPKKYTEKHNKGFRRAIANNKIENNKPRIVEGLKKDGSLFPLEISFNSWVQNDKIVFCAFINDVTKRQKSEEKLRQSDAILNRINSLVLVADGKGNITYASPSVKTILGYKPKDVLGEGWWQLTFTDLKLLNKTKKTIRNYHSNKASLPVLINIRKIKTKEGEYKYIEWYVSKGGDNAIIAIGIDVTERQHQANVKEVIHKISKFANDTPNLDRLLPYVRNTLHTVIDTTNFFIALYDDKKDSFNVLFRIDEEDTSRDDYLLDFKKGKTLSGYVFNTQKALLSTSSIAKKLYKEGIIEEGGVKSKCWLGTPLVIENKVIGVMVVQSYTNAKAFSKDDMALLDLVATNISLVIKKSKDYERIRLLNKALIQSPESVIVTNIKGEIEYVNPAFTKLSGYTEQEAIGENPRLLKSGDHPDAFYKSLWYTISSGETWEGEFINKRKDGSKYLVKANISSIKSKEGIITHYIGVEEDITEKRKLERDFIHAFIDAQELEKQSFGEELHDGISQILAAESMFIQVVINQNKDILDAKSLGYLENVKKLNLSAIDEARNISHGLMSKQLKEKGLLEAVENICIDYSQTRDIVFNFRTENLKEEEINNEIKTNIFRLIQEISTNIVRHSLAKIAYVSLSKTPNNKLLLVISDDGIGIDFEKMKVEKRGAGLKNIERRIKLLNGNYKLESEPDKGVKYTIEVPLETIQ